MENMQKHYSAVAEKVKAAWRSTKSWAKDRRSVLIRTSHRFIDSSKQAIVRRIENPSTTQETILACIRLFIALFWLIQAASSSSALGLFVFCSAVGLEVLYWRWRARSWSQGLNVAGQLWGELTLNFLKVVALATVGILKVALFLASVALFIALIGLKIGLLFGGADMDVGGFEPGLDMDLGASMEGLGGIDMGGIDMSEIGMADTGVGEMGIADAGMDEVDPTGAGEASPPLESVDGYVREDGTVVDDYVRTEADGIEENNLGHSG